jgi:hypothetical protein
VGASNDTIGRVWIGLARLDEVFASCDNVIALAIRETAPTKLRVDFIPSKIARRIPVHMQFILQFLGPSDGLWPLTHKILQLFLDRVFSISNWNPLLTVFVNCKIFTANEYFTYPYKHHGGNQRLTSNADSSLEERYILTAIFFMYWISRPTNMRWLFYIPIRIPKSPDSIVVRRWATLLIICVLFIIIHVSYTMVRYCLSPWYHLP